MKEGAKRVKRANRWPIGAASAAAVLAGATVLAALAGCAAAPGGGVAATADVRAATIRSAGSGAHGADGAGGRATAHGAQTAACDPTAASLRPAAGPPQVTPGSFMAKILARGYLIAGVSQSSYHFGFLNPLDGQTEGFDIDMIHAVAKAIFGNPNKVEFKAITDDQRIPDVQNGSVDIVAETMTITCDRLKQVDFSSVYFDANTRVLVLKNSKATGLASLGGQKVCATAGSTDATLISTYPVNPHPIAVTVPQWTDCLVELQQGQVAAICSDDSILAGLRAQDPFTQVVGPPFAPQPYGLAISNQHPDFVRFVNAVLAQERADGAWAASYVRWVSGPGTTAPPPPTAQYAS